VGRDAHRGGRVDRGLGARHRLKTEKPARRAPVLQTG
jgi:hypothetical protein